MHGKAKCSGRFLWAIIKVCNILLTFFLAGFQCCLFKLELGWYSAGPAKAGDPTSQIPRHQGLHPAQAGDTLRANTLCWHFDETQFKMTESTFFLTLGLCFEQKWERGTMQSSLSQKVFLWWRWGLWSQYSKWDVWLLFLCSSSRWSEPSSNIPYDSQLCPLTSLWPFWTCFMSSNTPCSFLL